MVTTAAWTFIRKHARAATRPPEPRKPGGRGFPHVADHHPSPEVTDGDHRRG